MGVVVSLRACLAERMRVADLVAQGPQWQVRLLRDIKHVVLGWLDDFASKDGPQVAEDPKETALAAPVRAGDQTVHAGTHLKAHPLYKHVSVGGRNRDLAEVDDAVLLDDTSTQCCLVDCLDMVDFPTDHRSLISRTCRRC